LSSCYERHIFFCLNQRDDGRSCCLSSDAESMQVHAKQHVKELGLSHPRDGVPVERLRLE
jgi:hypothetical protein